MVQICEKSWKKTFGAPKSFFLRFWGPRKKTFWGPKSFFSIATKSGMTASAYLVNFKINLGDLAEVALIWPDIYLKININKKKKYIYIYHILFSYPFQKGGEVEVQPPIPRSRGLPLGDLVTDIGTPWEGVKHSAHQVSGFYI